jgi:hypothetical protein
LDNHERTKPIPTRFQKVPGFHFTLVVSSAAAPGSGVPEIQLHLTVDSRQLIWFSVSAFRLSDFGNTSFDSKSLHVDQLKLGIANPELWPSWLVKAAQVLKVKWAPDVFVISSFRGSKRDQLIQWLGLSPVD